MKAKRNGVRGVGGKKKQTEQMEQDRTIRNAKGEWTPGTTENEQDSKKTFLLKRFADNFTGKPKHYHVYWKATISSGFVLLVLLPIFFLQQLNKNRNSSLLSNIALLPIVPLQLVPQLKVKRIVNISFSNLSHIHLIPSASKFCKHYKNNLTYT